MIMGVVSCPLQSRLEIAVPFLGKPLGKRLSGRLFDKLDAHGLEAAVDDHFHAGDEGGGFG